MPYSEKDIRDYVRGHWHIYGPKGLGWRSPEACIWHYAKDNKAFAEDLTAVDDLIQRINDGWSIDDAPWPRDYGNDHLAARREEIAKIEMRMTAETEAAYYAENDAAYFAELIAAGIRRMQGDT